MSKALHHRHHRTQAKRLRQHVLTLLEKFSDDGFKVHRIEAVVG